MDDGCLGAISARDLSELYLKIRVICLVTTRYLFINGTLLLEIPKTGYINLAAQTIMQ